MARPSLRRSASSSAAPAAAPAGAARLAVCFGWMTAFFPLEAQQEVWDNPDNLLAVSYVPTPKVEVVDGGIKISGSWPWASGVDSAAWLILCGDDSRQGRAADAGMVPGAGQRRGRRSRQLERQRAAGHRIEDGSHHRSGLRAATIAFCRLARSSPARSRGSKSRITTRPASAIRPSVRPRWSRRSSAWRRARSMPSPRRRATPSAWRDRACSRRSPNRR